jgi:DNA helicase-2/ATP-dependent DNA helicase PcrA
VTEPSRIRADLARNRLRGSAPSDRGTTLGRVDSETIFAGLNPEQRRAVEAVRGPVCILAGAGSGKTTTITRRIANQVATGTFRAEEILAVTFTDKAAGEMRERLERLGVAGVRARTFHAAALGQLHMFGRGPEAILPSKAIVLANIARALPRPYRFRPVGDIATEIEWAKNRRLTPKTYADAIGERRTPLPPDLMTRVFKEYERRKASLGKLDFEDVLELAIRMLEDDPHALADLRERVAAITVDEFQDVNLLQWRLLQLWLGPRDDLCVVGDDHQAIYSFTGATPRYLLDLPRRLEHSLVVRLEENYRSTPEVLALANRLSPRLGGVEKELRAVREGGPEPVVRPFAGPEETRFVVERIAGLRDEGVPLPEIAVLYRTNARSAVYEQALGEAGIPFQVREGGFLTRQAARRLRSRLRSASGTGVAASVRAAAEEEGLVRDPPEELGEQELVRQADLARLVELALEFDDGARTLPAFWADLDERFGPRAVAAAGVQLLTLHRAKGLEFEAVFVPRLEEKELPIRQAKSREEIAEERRLLYVGITRAKRWLHLTWSSGAVPSRFLVELGLAEDGPRRRSAGGERRSREPLPDTPTVKALRDWRRERAKADGVPAYVVFHDTTLAEIAARLPASHADLAAVPGIGPAKLERYGDDLLAALAAVPAAA